MFAEGSGNISKRVLESGSFRRKRNNRHLNLAARAKSFSTIARFIKVERVSISSNGVISGSREPNALGEFRYPGRNALYKPQIRTPTNPKNRAYAINVKTLREKIRRSPRAGN